MMVVNIKSEDGDHRVNFGLHIPAESGHSVGAREFLSWARTDINGGDRRAIGNALGNIKKAIHRRIDEIISTSHARYGNDWNPIANTETKLDVLKRLGVEYRSIVNLLTNIRNDYEHKYQLPDLEDARAYYEIADLWLERSYERYCFSSAGLLNVCISEITYNWPSEGDPIEEISVTFGVPSNVVYLWDPKKVVVRISESGSRTETPYADLTVAELLEIERRHSAKIISENGRDFNLTRGKLTQVFQSYERWLNEQLETTGT